MKAVRVHRFGPPDVIVHEDIPKPIPGPGEVLVRIVAAGVGPWDAWIRAGKSALPQPLPLTLGSDIAGVVEALGDGVSSVVVGDEVFGVSNARFIGGYAEYSAASAAMIARKPKTLDFIQAASMPVVSVTAWQMLSDAACLTPGQSVMVLGAGGSVGRLAVQFAHRQDLHVLAVASAADKDALIALGADQIVDARAEPIEQKLAPVDAVIDLVGGDLQNRSFAILKPGGIMVSAVSQPDPAKAKQHDVQVKFFLVDVTATDLSRISVMADHAEVAAFIGRVLPLSQARTAHEMLDGVRPPAKGKIVLDVEGAGG